MTRRKRTTIAVSAALAVAAACGLALAGPRVGRGERLVRHLELTESQREQIREIRESRWNQGLGTAAKRHMETRQALARAIADPAGSEEALREAARAHADAEVVLALERRETRRRISEVLTPEQREKAEALRERAMARAEHRFAARNAWFTSTRLGRVPISHRGGGRRSASAPSRRVLRDR